MIPIKAKHAEDGASFRRRASALTCRLLKFILPLWRKSGRIARKLFQPRMLQVLARIGHGAYGLLYLLLGGLATMAGLSDTRPPSVAGVFSNIGDLPVGWLMLTGIAAGVSTFAGWRLIQAIMDLRRDGSEVKGILIRGGKLVEAGLYFGVGLLAAAIALGWRELLEGERSMATVWTARALDWPLGHWLVGLVGLGAIAMGVDQIVKAHGSAFEDISARERTMKVIRILGRIGLAAKGLIFSATGVLFLIAAWRVEASAAGGLRAALRALASVPLGDSILLAVSAGLATFGAFNLMKAWFHKRPSPKPN